MTSTASPSSPNPDWDRLLMACQKNQVEVVEELLLEDGVDPCHANAIGQSALHIAGWWGHGKIVEILLEKGANVHAANTFTGATPLHCVIQSSSAALRKSQRLQCIDLLLQYGADPQTVDMMGRTPLHYLEEEDIDRKDILPKLQQTLPQLFELLLLKNNSKNNNSKNNVEKIRALLAQDPTQANVANHQTRVTPLLKVVQEWVDDDDNNNNTAALEEEDDFYPTVFQLLVEAGADISSTNDDDQSCLDLLSHAILQRYKQTQTLEDTCLQSWMAAVPSCLNNNHNNDDNDDDTNSNNTIIMMIPHDTWLEVARRNLIELAKLWKQWGLSPVGVTNRQGMTPLQFAARSGHFQMVEWLLQSYQCQKELSQHTDQRGQTALDAARANQHEAVVQLLQNHLEEEDEKNNNKE